MPHVKALALDFKTLPDAMRIRNRVIDMFERADRESDPGRRQELLTFVIVGGGFAGVELAGALNDFARGILADFLNLRAADVRVILVHARDRILPELSEKLGRYALERMTARGVTFKLNDRLADACADAVVLESSEEIRTQTLVWTAGTVPNRLLRLLPINRDKRGAGDRRQHTGGAWPSGIVGSGRLRRLQLTATQADRFRLLRNLLCVKRARWPTTFMPASNEKSSSHFAFARMERCALLVTIQRVPS
jgi:hypothetical protein